MNRFELVDGRSELVLLGRSSVHPLEAKTENLRGFFEASFDEKDQIDLSRPIRAQVEVLVESLQSENSLIDRELRSRLDTHRFPKAIATLSTLRRQQESDRFTAEGELTLHGVTRKIESELNIQKLNSTVEIEGELTIDVRDFKVSPPNLMIIKVHPQILAKLRFVAQGIW